MLTIKLHGDKNFKPTKIPFNVTIYQSTGKILNKS